MSTFDTKSLRWILGLVAVCFIALIAMDPAMLFVNEYLTEIAQPPVGEQPSWDFENKFIKMADLSYAGVWSSVRASTAYYVSASGSGTTCSLASPCSAHIAAGARDLSAFNPQPDDVVYWEPGHYTFTSSTNIVFKQQGSLGHPVINMGQYWLGKVEIDCNYDTSGNSQGQWQCIGFLQNSPATQGNYIRIMGFWLENNNNTVIRSCAGCLNFPTNMSDAIQMNGAGKELLFNWVHDGGDGIENFKGTIGNSVYGGQTVRGNFVQYSGYIDTTTRGSGHNYYIENPDVSYPNARSTYEGNIGLRAFAQGLQLYATTSQLTQITLDNHLEAANGIPIASPYTWPALSCCNNTYYWGASGGMNEEAFSCKEPGSNPGSKALFNLIATNNWSFAGATGMTWGGSKGLCDDTIQGNTFFDTGGLSVTCNTTSWIYPTALPTPGAPTPTPHCTSSVGCCHNESGDPLNVDGKGCGFYSSTRLTPTPGNTTMIIGGAGALANTFYGPTPVPGSGSAGCPLPSFNSNNWPGNTWINGLPGSGKQVKVWANPDVPGAGWVALANFDGSPTYSINLDTLADSVSGQKVIYAGENLRIQNWQDVDPWDATKDLTTVQCAATCGSVSVNTAAASIRQPGFLAEDGVTLFRKPPDLGPTYVVYMIYPRWDTGATTPSPTMTPTGTASATSTPTNTATNTPTQTFTSTPVNTNTPSQTPVNTNTPTYTRTATLTPTPTPAVINSTQFSVGQCKAFAPMSISTDNTAPGGNSASSTTIDNGDLVCTFNVPADGTYRVWVSVNATASNADSFFLDVDGDNSFNSLTPTPTPNGNTPTPTAVPANTHVFDSVEFHQPCSGTQSCVYGTYGWPTGGFVWNQMNDRTAGSCGSCSGSLAERDLVLTVAGNPHTLSFRTREATGGLSAKIAYIYLTTDLASDPPNIGTPTPTPTYALCKQLFRCNGKQGYKSVPCPMINDGAVPKGSNIPCPLH